MFIYVEIVKTEYYQREKNEKIKQFNNNDKNINNEKKNTRNVEIPRKPGFPTVA